VLSQTHCLTFDPAPHLFIPFGLHTRHRSRFHSEPRGVGPLHSGADSEGFRASAGLLPQSATFHGCGAATLKAELHRLIVDGIKYERISGGDPDFEWQMELFKQDEIINYPTAIQVKRSVYEYVVYDSETLPQVAGRL